MTSRGLAQNRIFVLSRPGDADSWRQRIEGDLRSRGIIATNLSEAAAVIVIIGLHFQARSPSSRKSDDDVTHKQLRQALATTKIIIPILVDGASMPDSRTLPQDIQQFSYRQALTVKTESDLPGVLARAISATRSGPVVREVGQAKETAAVQWRPTESVFISYRRDDTGYWARLLARSLALELGPEAVFFDEGSERPGLDFRAQFENFLYQSTDVVAVIGNGFLEADAQGKRRIDRPEDYVRREIRTALSLRKRIHVVLVGQAQMPAQEQLPDDIAGLAVYRANHRLTSKGDIEGIRDGILKWNNRPGAGLSFLSPATRGLSTYLGTPNYGARASAVRSELAKHGWTAVDESDNPQNEIVLVNSQFPNYRMVLQVNLAEVALEERVKGALTLGLGRWIKRAIFSISPHTLDDLDALRLPDRLLEAALDPDHYLDRTDRVNLRRGKQPPMMSDQLLGNLQIFLEPNAEAIEAHHRLKRRLASKGKLERLVYEGDIKLPGGAKPRTVAISPNGDAVVVGSNRGLFRISGQDWRMTTLKEGDSYQSVDISPAGHIAACSDDNNISLWHTGGAVMEDSVSPYSWWRKISADPWIKSPSWSPDGNLLACCDRAAIWIYSILKREFSRWEYPVEQEYNGDYGLKFAPNGRELAVFAYTRFLWSLDANSGAVRRSYELPTRPFNFSWAASKPREPQEKPAFYDFHDIDLSPRGDVLACAGSDGQIMLVDFGSLSPRQTIVGHEPLHNGFSINICKIAFSHDGRRLASLGSENQLVMWDTECWEPIGESIVSWPFVGSGRRVIAWYPDATRIIGCAEDALEVWRL